MGEFRPLEALLSWLLVGVRESLGVSVGLLLWCTDSPPKSIIAAAAEEEEEEEGGRVEGSGCDPTTEPRLLEEVRVGL